MKIEELKSKGIIWGMTPQNDPSNGSMAINSQADIERLQRKLKAAKGIYFIIDVWDCNASLAICENTADGRGRIERVQQDCITDDELEDAVYDAGGAINLSGWYPITPGIGEKLKAFLGGKNNDKP